MFFFLSLTFTFKTFFFLKATHAYIAASHWTKLTLTKLCTLQGVPIKQDTWRLKICIVWRGRSGWSWDKCAECRWRIESAVWICTVFWVYRVWRMWWGVAEMWQVAGVRYKGRNRKTWREYVKDDMEVLSLRPECAVFRDMWRDFHMSKRLTLA